MPDPHRRRYRIRTALAGSFLAAAAAASLTGFAAAPASAASSIPAFSAGRGDLLGSVGNGGAGATPAATAARERLAGVRADLDQAVLLRMVAPDQADVFYAQIQRRVAAGL
jgi:hypothetical protein